MRLERTPDKREVGSSTLPRPTNEHLSGGVAQLGERLLCTQEAIGSNPFTSTVVGEQPSGVGVRGLLSAHGGADQGSLKTE